MASKTIPKMNAKHLWRKLLLWLPTVICPWAWKGTRTHNNNKKNRARKCAGIGQQNRKKRVAFLHVRDFHEYRRCIFIRFLFHSNKTFVVLFISDIQSEHWLPFSLVCLSNWIAQCVKFAIARANTCLHFGPTMRFSRSPILSSYFSPIQPNFSTILYKYTQPATPNLIACLYTFSSIYIHILHVMHIYTCKYSTSTATHQYQLCWIYLPYCTNKRFALSLAGCVLWKWKCIARASKL